MWHRLPTQNRARSMNKKTLTEADIRTKYITPALVGPNGDKWNVMTQIREEVYFTRGRVIVRGKTVKRGEAKKADYILSYKPNLPLAVLETKDNNHSVGTGIQQALEYAEILDVPFAYSSNGDAFLEHDRTATSGVVTREIPLDQFPSPEELWARYCAAKGLTPNQQKVTTQDYYDDGSQKSPRYYQLVAINRTVDAIRSLFAATSPSVPNSTTPCMDAATAEPTKQSNQWLSGCSGRRWTCIDLKRRIGFARSQQRKLDASLKSINEKFGGDLRKLDLYVVQFGYNRRLFKSIAGGTHVNIPRRNS